MPDITTISAALSSIKAATDIAKCFLDSEVMLEKAEMKLRVADLVSELAKAKIELSSVQELIIEKDQKIIELQEAFESKGSLVRKGDAYYETNTEGKPIGVPFCIRCWEGEHKKRQLVSDVEEFRSNVCTNCGQRYGSRSTYTID